MATFHLKPTAESAGKSTFTEITFGYGPNREMYRVSVGLSGGNEILGVVDPKIIQQMHNDLKLYLERTS